MISTAQQKAQRRIADSFIDDAGWKPRAVERPKPGTLNRSRRTALTQAPPKVSLKETLVAIRDDDSLLNDVEYRVLYAMRTGIEIALALAEEYKIIVGIDRIGDILRLSNEKQTELQEKSRTAAAIVLFTLARYVQHTLGAAGDGRGYAEHVTLPEFVLDEPHAALRALLYYVSANLRHPTVKNDTAIISTVSVLCEKVMDEVESRRETFTHLSGFEAITFGVESTDFTIDGLNRHELGVTSVEFNRVEMSDIVGNADAKHFARRQVMRMLCYNFKAEQNVFTKLGGLAPVWMGYGKPGTGKSMLIAAMATMFKDYCDVLGIPFHFHPLPDNIIDSYQGNSAKNMVAWMKGLQDPTRITFMPVDDAENILEERTRQGVSEGVRAAIGVFLRYTEGAYAINRGNATIGVFTNLAEQIDAAVRSRIQGRMLIDGADTPEDFLDQDYLWFRKFANQKGFNNLFLPTYEYMSAQRLLRSMGEAEETRDEPAHATVLDIFKGVEGGHDPLSHDFFAQLYMMFMERFSAFSSRDVRNIQSAVNQRIMDFDLPETWFENPETFCQLELERQEGMILELRNANMRGLSFAEIYRQEAVRYLDNYARIADAEFDREVEARIKQVRIVNEVERRMKKKV
jgi:SpoVK/Ycf46/Vps4 family AAA+-type ATPase